MKSGSAESMSAPQAFYFALANLEIPEQMLGKSHAVLGLKMGRRFKIATLSSAMAAFLDRPRDLALALGRVLGIFYEVKR